MGKAILITLAVLGALALTCVGASLIGGLWISAKSGPPEGIVTTVTIPDSVTVGESFEIVVTISNSLNRARTIKDIDFYDPLLEGVRVVSVDPMYNSFDPSFGMSTFTMEHELPAGASIDVTFVLEARTHGLYGGDVDVSVDSILSFTSETRTLLIEPAP